MRTRVIKALKWALAAALAFLIFLGAEALYILKAPVGSAWRTVNSDQQDTVDFAHYPYSKTVNAYMADLCSKYPDLMRATEIGRTYQDRPLFMYTLTGPEQGEPSSKPGFLVVAQQHAREPIACQTALYFITSLLEEYGKDETVTNLLDTRVAYIAPQANPDGNDLFLSEDEALRGNARPTDADNDGRFNEDRREAGLNCYQKWVYLFKPGWVLATKGRPFDVAPRGKVYSAGFLGWVDNANRPVPQTDKDGDGKAAEDPIHGVDLNRNWAAAWQKGDPNLKSETYRGPSAFSEPENRALRDFALSHPNVVSYLDLHSGTNSYLYPPALDGSKPPDAAIHDEIGSWLAKALSLEGFPFTSSQNTDPVGRSADWFYSQGVFASTLEVFGDQRTYVTRRLWPTTVYVRYTSLSRSFNPAPEDIEKIVSNRLTGILYLFAAMK